MYKITRVVTYEDPRKVVLFVEKLDPGANSVEAVIIPETEIKIDGNNIAFRDFWLMCRSDTVWYHDVNFIDGTINTGLPFNGCCDLIVIRTNGNVMNPDARSIFKEDNKPYTDSPIKKVVFNPPATIIFWNDGTKTVVKARDEEDFDHESGVKINFKLKEENEMTKRDMNYILKLEAALEESERKRKYWIEKYESEHKRANSLDKKYNEVHKTYKELRDNYDVSHRSSKGWIEECWKWREEARRVREELKLPLSADTERVVREIHAIKTNLNDERNNYADTLKLRRFKQELGDILGVSKEASYPEFVKDVAILKNANETQAKSIHDTLDALIKLRKEKDDEERKLRDLLNIANGRRDEAIELNDDIRDDISDIWAICCDADVDDAVGLGFDDLISDIYEFCDMHSTADNAEISNRKLICDLYSSIFGLEAGSKESCILISEIIKKLEIWENDRLEEKKHLIDEQSEVKKKHNDALDSLQEAYKYIIGVPCTITDPYIIANGIKEHYADLRKRYIDDESIMCIRARKAEQKLSDISKIVGADGADRNRYKY